MIGYKLGVPTGKAQAMLTAVRLSKEVRAIRINPETESIPPDPATDGSEQFLYEEKDFLYWLDQQAPQTKPKTIREQTTRATRAGKKQIPAIVRGYREKLLNGRPPSIKELERFAQKSGLVGWRKELRDEYHKQFKNQRVGRPSK